MKIYSWNVNGIRAVEKKSMLEVFISKENPDIICFQEIKAHPDQLDEFYKDYVKYWNPARKKGYAGTSIWLKEKPLNVTYNLPEDIAKEYNLTEDKYGDPNQEGRIITAELTNYFVVTVYTPNSKGDLSRLKLRQKKWDPAFLNYVKKLEKHKPVIFCGDLNVAHTEIDLANPKPNKNKNGFTIEERSGMDNIINSDLVDSFRHFNKEPKNYTWWSHFAKSRERNVGWRIDYFIISKSLLKHLKSSEILPNYMGSDHCPIKIEMDN